MAETLLVLTILLLMALTGLIAWSRYRQHKRRADARSRAALNRLLAEADEIEQRARRGDNPDEYVPPSPPRRTWRSGGDTPSGPPGSTLDGPMAQSSRLPSSLSSPIWMAVPGLGAAGRGGSAAGSSSGSSSGSDVPDISGA